MRHNTTTRPNPNHLHLAEEDHASVVYLHHREVTSLVLHRVKDTIQRRSPRVRTLVLAQEPGVPIPIRLLDEHGIDVADPELITALVEIVRMTGPDQTSGLASTTDGHLALDIPARPQCGPTGSGGAA